MSFTLMDKVVAPVPPVGDTLLAEWLGNSSPGQLKDSSGNGYDLALSGAVDNASSPTPPEGDRWLAYGSVGVNNYLTTNSSAAIDKDYGKIEFYITNETSWAGQSFALVMREDSAGMTMIFMNQASDVNMSLVAFSRGSLFQNDSMSFPINGNIPYKVTLKWGSDGLFWFLNDAPWSSVSSSSFTFNTTPELCIGGDHWSTEAGWRRGGIDAFRTYRRIS